MEIEYDFKGWASRANVKCKDGRTIMPNAFIEADGIKVPLVWSHQHNDPTKVLGHAILENRPEGLYAYGYFNDTEQGKNAKIQLQHGDVDQLSIWANDLDEDYDGLVHHGTVRELSLVLAGANPGAFIESVISHGMPMGDDENEGYIYSGSNIEVNEKEDLLMSDQVEDILNTLSDEEQNKLAAALEEATDENGDVDLDLASDIIDIIDKEVDDEDDVEDYDDEDDVDDVEDYDDEENYNYEEGGDEMSHNVFENEGYYGIDEEQEYIEEGLQHSLENAIRTKGSLKDALANTFGDDVDVIAHSLDTTGMDVATGSQTYGFNDPDMLFPDYKMTNPIPEFISRNMNWVEVVLNGVKKTPFSRVKVMFADITEDEARAKGYVKATQKVEEVFSLLKRQTDPQTIYKMQKMDRDDIIDITSFDVVEWIRKEMRVMLNEEIARAILFGDGRVLSDPYKIKEDHIRPIASDVPLFNTKVNVPKDSTDDDSKYAKKVINAVIKARKHYKGSGNPIFFTTEDVLTSMLLIEDGIGRKLYKSESEVATALRCSKIVTVEPMENQKVDNKNLIGLIVNLTDYSIGMDKGGNISSYNQFDIQFNQERYLIETRMSGALTKPFSALTILETEGTTVQG